MQCNIMSSSVYLLGKAGKKSFMYFSSSLGKGFIISDDEEVTGVISVRSKVSRDRCTLVYQVCPREKHNYNHVRK